MKRLWRWLAAGGAALVAVLAGVWGLVHWRGRQEQLNRELDKSIEKEEQRRTEAEATLARESERGQAALAEAHRKAMDGARDGAGPERLHRRLSPRDGDT